MSNNFNMNNIITDNKGSLIFDVEASNDPVFAAIDAHGTIKGNVNPDLSREYDELYCVYANGRISSETGNIILPHFKVGAEISARNGSVEVQEINGSRINLDVIAGKDIHIETASMAQHFIQSDESKYNLNIVSSKGIISIGELKSVNDPSLRHLNNANLQSTKAVVIGKLENNSWQGINVDSPILILPKSDDEKALIPPPENFNGKVIYATAAELKDEAKLNGIIDAELGKQAAYIKEAQNRLKDRPEYHESILNQIGKVPATKYLDVGILNAISTKPNLTADTKSAVNIGNAKAGI